MHKEKQAYKEKIDAEIKEWDAKIDLLKAKGNNLVADAKVEWEEQLKNLEEARKNAGDYLAELVDDADDKWDDIKDEAAKKWDTFASAVQNVVSKYT